jgi:hypothetical protein
MAANHGMDLQTERSRYPAEEETAMNHFDTDPATQEPYDK